MFHVSEREISIIITCLEMFFGAVARRFDCKEKTWLAIYLKLTVIHERHVKASEGV